MDPKTIAAYDQSAKDFTSRHLEIVPQHLYHLIENYFIPQGTTLDLGSGSGRDTNWLKQKSFIVRGCEPSKEMLNFALKTYPECNFYVDSLPLLASTKADAFQNVLCSAVLMHLPISDHKVAIENIYRILQKYGVLILSYRNSLSPTKREDGRYFESIDIFTLINYLSGFEILLKQVQPDDKREGIVWTNIVARKT